MNVSFITLGCKTNQAESSFIESELKRKGVRIVDKDGTPDFCIINTCTVTAKSDCQSRQEIRRAVKSGAKVIVTGCYSELHKKEINAIHEGISVINNSNKFNIINVFDNITSDNTSCFSHSEKSRLFLKVQDGCNNACTYCIIPVARGKSVSTDLRRVVEYVQEISHYFNEVVLTGIHLGSYGKDLSPQSTLAGLLKHLLLETDIQRIRLSSLEFNEIGPEIIELLAEKRICNHLHIPIQSGDDHVLGKMGRAYTRHEYLMKINEIFHKYPDISIGTDILVGFPFETDESFQNTYKLVESLPYSYLHVFPFSSRPNTIASLYGDPVNQYIKNERSERLRSLGKNKTASFKKRQIGKTLACLIERAEGDNSYIGLSENYLRVRTDNIQLALKSIVPLRVIAYDNEMLMGVPIN